MPRFTGNLSDAAGDDIVKYVTTEIQHPDNPGGFGLGGLGPVAEGFVGLACSASASWPSSCFWVGERSMTISTNTARRSSLAGLATNDPHLQPAARRTHTLVERGHRASVSCSARSAVAGFGAALLVEREALELGATLGARALLLRHRTRRLGQVPHAARPVRRRAPHARELRGRSRRLRGRDRRARRRRRQASQAPRGTARRGMGIFGIVAHVPAAAQSRAVAQGHALSHRLAQGLLRGRPVRTAVEVGDLAVGSIVTVFPEGTREHRPRPGRRPDGADSRSPTRTSRPMKGRETWGPQGLRRVLQGLHAPGLSGRALRAAAAAARLPVPPVDVQRHQRRGAAVRTGAPPLAPAAALRRRLRASSAPRVTTTQPVGPGFWERTSHERRRDPHQPRAKKQAARPLRPGRQVA